ncbi:MAG TPA: hypothetical protein PLO29_06810 [Paludibacter sp.]|jgi:hypothetical protein|nr:MAG: hypothetical protein BWY08_00781 [Bacteroidetes bacterium ADurb.Bin174]HNY44742.1 hypothetical protein [Bacteroidales bacterium]HQB28643.1 hypothetical protein [Paludibacter sp.]
MFRYESEMIPVLIDNLSKVFKTEYIATEFSTGNGVADLVFTTEMNDEDLFLNDYALMSLFVNLFQQNKHITTKQLQKSNLDKNKLKKLLIQLEVNDFIKYDGEVIKRNRKYKAHTRNLLSVEAKLNDWKSGFYQALRYKFFSHQSYLAYPEKNIHRVDLDLLKEHNIGLISVGEDRIRFISKPKTEKPKDLTSYFFLSELFAQQFKTTQAI